MGGCELARVVSILDKAIDVASLMHARATVDTVATHVHADAAGDIRYLGEEWERAVTVLRDKVRAEIPPAEPAQLLG